MKFLYTLFLTATIALFSCNFAKANDTFFIENKGQVKNEKGQLDQSVLFTYATSEMEVFVRKNGLTYQFKRYDGEGVHAERVDVNWKGASESAVSKSLRSVYSENYILDGEWIKARAFQEVFIANVYPGVDWRMYITESGLKYEFIAENAAAAKQIKMQVEGAEELEKCTNGSLLIKAEMGQVSDAKPVYFNQGKQIDGNFILNENAIQFEIPSHTKGELVLDLEVIWTSYYGGTGNDVGNDIVVDSYGGIYVAGSTSSMSAFALAS